MFSSWCSTFPICYFSVWLNSPAHIPCLFVLDPLNYLVILIVYLLLSFPFVSFSFAFSNLVIEFQFFIHFSLGPLWWFYLSIEFHFQVLDCLNHFHQPCICVFLGNTQLFILSNLFLLDFIKLFIWVFFKFLEYFDDVYDCSFKFCNFVFI